MCLCSDEREARSEDDTKGFSGYTAEARDSSDVETCPNSEFVKESVARWQLGQCLQFRGHQGSSACPLRQTLAASVDPHVLG